MTELVSDLDLVHEQIAIAAGEPLSERVLAAAERAAQPVRHAIEVRLSAEDPASSFMPGPGRVSVWRPADGPGVRVDSGIEEGSVIPGDYDSMFAKLMVVAVDRPAAIARMRRALAETLIAGVQTTLPFDRWLLERDEFTDDTGAGLSTDLIARTWEPAPIAASAALRATELVALGVLEAAPAPAGAGQDARGTRDRRLVADRRARSAGHAAVSAPRRERISVAHAQLVVQPAPEEVEQLRAGTLWGADHAAPAHGRRPRQRPAPLRSDRRRLAL